jgi:hypothetical protein
MPVANVRCGEVWRGIGIGGIGRGGGIGIGGSNLQEYKDSPASSVPEKPGRRL